MAARVDIDTARQATPVFKFAAILALLLAIAGCGGGDSGPTQKVGGSDRLIRADPANEGKSIRIGSKRFTESFILAQIYGQALEKAGYSVELATGVGDERVATRAMQEGRIDGYPEYTGTALLALLGVDPKDVPKAENEAYQLTRRGYAEKYGFVAFPPTPFTDSNALGMTKEKAAELGDPRKISDLEGKAQDLTLAASAECFKRTDCALGFKRVYGLEFKKEIRIDVAQRHEVILQNKADLTIPFTTDGQIATNDEVILDDDKDLFPPYNATFVLVGKKARELGPGAEKTITTVQKGLTTPVMQELNSRVDLDKQKPEKVAADYLREGGYVE